MKERPILFSGPMVKPIMNLKPGVWPAEPIDPAQAFKWMTRRVIKPQPETEAAREFEIHPTGLYTWCDNDGKVVKCPYGKPGDRLWVRENFAIYDLMMKPETFNEDNENIWMYNGKPKLEHKASMLVFQSRYYCLITW